MKAMKTKRVIPNAIKFLESIKKDCRSPGGIMLTLFPYFNDDTSDWDWEREARRWADENHCKKCPNYERIEKKIKNDSVIGYGLSIEEYCKALKNLYNKKKEQLNDDEKRHISIP
jgi:hypothetical protein